MKNIIQDNVIYVINNTIRLLINVYLGVTFGCTVQGYKSFCIKLIYTKFSRQ